jgi:hypothetical protein
MICPLKENVKEDGRISKYKIVRKNMLKTQHNLQTSGKKSINHI